jgi:hypothetical protein
VKKSQPGDHTVLRDIQAGKPLLILPVTVVKDEPGVLALWVSPGTPVLVGDFGSESHTREAIRRVVLGDWVMKRRKWEGRGSLSISQPGTPWRMMVFWNGPDEVVSSWYINLESPLQRVADGLDYSDKILDVLVAPDRTSWRWKDEDEVDEAVRRGYFTPEEVAELYRTGEEAAETVMAAEPPYDWSWADWKPNPEWGVPRLPPSVE